MLLRYILLIAILATITSTQYLFNEIQKINSWNHFKTLNVYMKWEQPSRRSTGAVFRAISNSSREDVFAVESPAPGKVSVLLPLDTGNRIVYTADIPKNHFPVQIVLVLNRDELLMSTVRCDMIMHLPIPKLDFKSFSPEIVSGSRPYFSDVTADNIGTGNPLIQLCSQYNNIPSMPLVEEIEVEDRIPIPAVPTSEPTRIPAAKMSKKTCHYEGEVYKLGEARNGSDSECEECICRESGTFTCSSKECPVLSCQTPIVEKGKCCPTRCGHPCMFNSRSHHDGAVFWPETCVRCTCFDGKTECQYKKRSECPPLPCPVEKQRFIGSECCPTCVNFDYCSTSPCHEDATCESTQFGAKCRCKEGFMGNGTICDDIDECLFDRSAKEQLGGCGMGTTCVNTRGSFKCDCFPGHPRLDERNCLDLLRV